MSKSNFLDTIRAIGKELEAFRADDGGYFAWFGFNPPSEAVRQQVSEVLERHHSAEAMRSMVAERISGFFKRENEDEEKKQLAKRGDGKD